MKNETHNVKKVIVRALLVFGLGVLVFSVVFDGFRKDISNIILNTTESGEEKVKEMTGYYDKDRMLERHIEEVIDLVQRSTHDDGKDGVAVRVNREPVSMNDYKAYYVMYAFTPNPKREPTRYDQNWYADHDAYWALVNRVLARQYAEIYGVAADSSTVTTSDLHVSPELERIYRAVGVTDIEGHMRRKKLAGIEERRLINGGLVGSIEFPHGEYDKPAYLATVIDFSNVETEVGKNLAQQALERITHGETFEELATKYTAFVPKGSRSGLDKTRHPELYHAHGNAWWYVPIDIFDFLPAFEDMKVGDISDPIITEKGVFLVKIHDIRPSYSYYGFLDKESDIDIVSYENGKANSHGYIYGSLF